MKRFKFRLQGVLNYRAQVKKNWEDKLAIKNKEVLEQDAKVRLLKNTSINTYNELEENLALGCKAEMIKLYADYIYSLNNDIHNEQLYLVKMKNEAEAMRLQLIKAAQDEKMLSILHDKYWDKYIEEFYKDEEKSLDDIVSNKYFKEKEDAR